MGTDITKIISQAVYDFYMGSIKLEDAAQQVMSALHRWQSSDDIVLPYLVLSMIGSADELLAAIICPVLGYYRPPEDVVDILRDLAEMSIICDESLCGEMILYRGVNRLANHGIDKGYSYTTDINIAKRFATGEYVADRWGPKANDGTVYTVRVPCKNIIGMNNDRNESEIIVLPPDAGGVVTVIDAIRVSSC